jgi:hypothetical protein
MSKVIYNALALTIFTVSLVLTTIITMDIINFTGQQSVFELFLWFIFGLITFVYGKIIILLNHEKDIDCDACHDLLNRDL